MYFLNIKNYRNTYTKSNAKCLLNGYTRFLFSKYLNEWDNFYDVITSSYTNVKSFLKTPIIVLVDIHAKTSQWVLCVD